MAQVDVSDLLHDPDFVDEIQLVDRKSSANLLGENVLQEVCIKSVGSVQPASGKAINRLPEALRVANLMSFWFQGVITAAAPGKYTAQLVFKGQRFQVQTVMDWSSWGAGWCEGTCVAQEIAP